MRIRAKALAPGRLIDPVVHQHEQEWIDGEAEEKTCDSTAESFCADRPEDRGHCDAKPVHISTGDDIALNVATPCQCKA